MWSSGTAALHDLDAGGPGVLDAARTQWWRSKKGIVAEGQQGAAEPRCGCLVNPSGLLMVAVREGLDAGNTVNCYST